MMVLICHNTDLGDGWEREGESHEYFKEFSEKEVLPDGHQHRDLRHDPLIELRLGEPDPPIMARSLHHPSIMTKERP